MFRPDFSRFDVYNDGLLIYLYDPANAAAILGSVPDTDQGPLDGTNLDMAARDGLILLVELIQDDELCFELGVGKPLTKKEIAGLPWLERARGYLHLPSGTLRVDSANSLALIPEESEEQGAEFRCKPGHYEVSIDRVSWSELGDVSGYDGADHVFTLQKTSKSKFGSNEPATIPAERFAVSIPVVQTPSFWDHAAPSGKVASGMFQGHAYFDEDKTFWLNLSPALAERLGLDYVRSDLDSDEELSNLVRIVIDDLDLEIRACINGHTYFEMTKKELAGVGREVATGLPQNCFFAGAPVEMVRFSWDKNSRTVKKKELERWFVARLERDDG